MEKIELIDGRLVVPAMPTIPFIEGDGVGKDIWPAVRQIVDAAVEKCYAGERKLAWLEVFAGEKAYNQAGTWLPAESLEAFRTYRVGIKGPLTTPVGGGIRSLNVALRQELDLYVCLRPTRWFTGVPSPIKHPELVDMVIFRENTEDIYAGIEWQAGSNGAVKLLRFLKEELGVENIRFPETSSLGIKPVSQQGSERLIRAAITYALQHHLPSVTLVHKGNIMKFTEGSFKTWGYDLAENEYATQVFTWRQYEAIKANLGVDAAQQALAQAKQQGKLIINDVIADAFMQNAILTPEKYSVIATLNLNGDYISDLLAAEVGGIGIAPGANINYQTGRAIFEATHGTAPDIAGTNRANPCSMLLSAVMLLDYLQWSEAAALITSVLEQTFSQGKATQDLARFMENGTELSTTEFACEIINSINA